METIITEMKKLARESLKNSLDLIIGWEEGRFDWQSKPAFITEADEIDRLSFNDYSLKNLAGYLLKDNFQDKKIGIFLKGCDYQAYQQLINYNQINPDNIQVWGIACPGLKERKFNGAISEADRCQRCQQPIPDELETIIGKSEAVNQNSPEDKYQEVKELETLTTAERFNYWQEKLSDCIRCYACRNTCPLCECKTCMLAGGDSNNDDWIDSAKEFSQDFFFHSIRAFHQAGRCIDCGECEEVCPVDIPLTKINNKIRHDIEILYGQSEIPEDESVKGPLLDFREDDPEPGSKGGNQNA
ncbi:MAG: 4Fe-4S dicluster domain-containing protein [Bacillota bacterium]